MTPDPVREYCRDRGYADHVVRGGLVGLVEGWERTVANVAECNLDYIYEWLNDMDGRHILHEVLPIASAEQCDLASERTRVADDVFLRETVPAEECLWGWENAEKRGWSPSIHWWYFRTPGKYQLKM